ncbi:MAG: terminase large subunit [Pseudomonadota bacterium]
MNGLDWIFDSSPIDDPAGHGERAVRALRKLKHPKSTAPNLAFQLDPPFERIVRRIYGPKNENGGRLVRTVYFQVGKGSRKTSLAAALGLLHTFGPERIARGENVVAAADRKQARIAFEEALAIVETQAGLSSKARPVDSRNRIIHVPSGSRFEAISSDAPTQHGRTPQFILVDELWAHKKADLWHALRTGATKTPGSLLIVATTAGRGNESPDYPVYEYARKVQAGEIIDPTFLPIIFEADQGVAWDDEEVWRSVLPGLQYGYPDLPSLRQLAREARERPADRASFEQFFLGIRQANSLSPFVEMAVFDQGRSDIDLEALQGRECWVAVDCSTTTDLTAVVAVFPDGEDYLCAAWGFVPSDNLQGRADRDCVPYPVWSREGWIIPTPGNVIDYRAVLDHVRDLCDRFHVREIAFDPAYAQPVMGPLTDDGYPCITLRQGWVTQSPALNALEREIRAGRLKWDSPVLRWCMENVSIHTDSAGNRTMHKGKSRDRIDLAVALWMAMSRATAGDPVSIYDSDEWSDDLAVF